MFALRLGPGRVIVLFVSAELSQYKQKVETKLNARFPPQTKENRRKDSRLSKPHHSSPSKSPPEGLRDDLYWGTSSVSTNFHYYRVQMMVKIQEQLLMAISDGWFWS